MNNTTKIFKNGIELKYVLLVIGILAVSGIAIATTDPIIGDNINYLDALNITRWIRATQFIDADNSTYYIDPANTGTSGVFAGNVGIKTTAPLRVLGIGTTADAETEISLITSPTGFSSVLFGDGTTGDAIYRGYIQYKHTSDSIVIATAATEWVTITSIGNVGFCGNSTPVNVFACTVGSATDPIADSWLQYSTPESKIVLGEADNLTEKYREDFRNTTVYRWKRTVNEPERLGVFAQKGTPPEILAYHDGVNNTNSTAKNATPQGIDLGAYIGWLHEVVKGQDMQIQTMQKQLDNQQFLLLTQNNQIRNICTNNPALCS